MYLRPSNDLFDLPSPWAAGVPETPYLTAWANSGKSGRKLALRLMAIPQARLEPLALSASGRERMFNDWAAASLEKRIDFPQHSPGSMTY
jgi:hypothetical protein